MGLLDVIMPGKAEVKDTRSALEAARAGHEDDGAITRLVQHLLDLGIDGVGPYHSAREVAARARAATSSSDGAIKKVMRAHVVGGGLGGFVTGLGGFVTLLVALPANVVEFYLLATRMVASIARVRGYDIDHPQIRSAILLTLVGADADDLLRKAGVVVSGGVGGKLTDLATQRLPGPALMVLNKGIGFRLLTRSGQSMLGRFGKAVPVVGGAVGAGLDVYLLGRIAANAKREFPRRAS